MTEDDTQPPLCAFREGRPMLSNLSIARRVGLLVVALVVPLLALTATSTYF